MFVTGRLAALAALTIPAVAVRPGWSTVGTIAAVLVVLVLFDIARAGSVRSLRIERFGDTSVLLGAQASTDLVVTNVGKRKVVGGLRDAWSPSAGAGPRLHELRLAPDEVTSVTTSLRPTRRGDRQPDRITIRATGPLGIAGRQGAHRCPWTLRTLPAFESRKHLPSRLTRLRELEGRTAVMVRGQGSEFDSLREYVDGDDVRSIDWRASARNADVMVRTWRPERDRRVLIVLDTGRTSAGRVANAPRLDASMDAALLLAALASRAGDHVDLLAYERGVAASVRGVDGAELLPALVNALAGVEPRLTETDMRGLVGTVLTRQRQRSLVVLLTTMDAAPLREGLMPVLGQLVARHQVVVCSVADPALTDMSKQRGSVDGAYAVASAATALAERAAAKELLERSGVEVVDAEPEALAPALADRYLVMKAAGRL